jgi:hypothetical protein
MTPCAALVLIAAFALASCDASAPTSTRLVGAHRVALAVPTEWKTRIERGDTCPPTEPGTVQFFAPLHGPVGSCVVPIGASWPAQDSVSVYTWSGDERTPTEKPAGSVHGLPYYISDTRQTGPGVAVTLSVPLAHVSFLVGAADRAAATALLATIRFLPRGSLCDRSASTLMPRARSMA